MFILIYSIFFYQTKNKIIYPVITLLLCLSSFINIIKASQPYTKRLNLLSSIMEGMDKNSPKIIASYSDFDIPNHWGTSMDALILSRCKWDTAKTIFLTEDKFGCYSDTTNPALFLYLPWDPYKIKTFNSIYFNLPAIPYKIYKKEQKKYSLLKQDTFDNTKDPNIRMDSTGNSFYKTLPDQEFCITNQRIFKELTKKDLVWVKVSMDIRFPFDFQGPLPCMVMTMEHKGGTYGYLAPEIKIDSAGNKWHKYELEYLSPEIRNKKDIWKCYIWKRGKSTFDIDNFKIEIYEPRY